MSAAAGFDPERRAPPVPRSEGVAGRAITDRVVETVFVDEQSTCIDRRELYCHIGDDNASDDQVPTSWRPSSSSGFSLLILGRW